MILLLGTTDSLAVITGSAVANIDMHCSYMDYNAGTVTPGSTNNVISSAATTTVAAAPGSGIQRNVKCLIVHNTHATSSNLVTVQVVSGATAVLYAYTLLAGETLQYYDTLGFQVMDASGGLKLSPTAGRLLKRSVVTSGTTFTSQIVTTTLYVRAVGGGGGGAGCTSVSSAASAGGGGGGGAYCEKTYTGQVGNKTFTIAIGGNGAGNSGAAGGNGGNTTFTDGTTLITAPGGTGAVVATAVTTVGTSYAGGAGGVVATNGDLNSGGDPGVSGIMTAVTPLGSSGKGGSSPFGSGGVGVTAAGNGNAGLGFGSGGGGALTGASAARTGGAGTGGCLVIEEYA